MTSGGGSSYVNAGGVIFRVKKDGTDYSILHSFGDASVLNDGRTPNGGLVLSGSVLYGMTPSGGMNGVGTIFRINTDGSGYAIVRSFGSYSDGISPMGSLTLSGSTLYGMTQGGGRHGVGVIFQVNTDGSGYSVLHAFGEGTDYDGAQPGNSRLTLSGSTLYGMTVGGGGSATRSGFGVIFKIDTDGAGYTVLHRFNDGTLLNDGYYPYGSVAVSGGVLFGMAGNTIFRINADGTDYTLLYSGWDSNGELTLFGATLYGMTSGRIFRINTDGSGHFTLHGFPDSSVFSDGYNAGMGLILSGSTLYGMTTHGGGGNAYGTVFSLTVSPPTVPGAPTGVTATAGNAQATVSFTAPASDGGSPVTSYTVTSSPGGIKKTGASSPITVMGLTNGTVYTFTVKAKNAKGIGPASVPSNSVTPGELPKPIGGLVAYYPFEENAIDHSGNNNHGTVFNAAYVQGKFGAGLQFTGASDFYVEVPHSESVLDAIPGSHDSRVDEGVQLCKLA